MAQNPNKKQVEQITDMEVDFAQWYTDVCRKAELIDYSSIKGMFIYRPYGYALWEHLPPLRLRPLGEHPARTGPPL